jgi:hypothetical protein
MLSSTSADHIGSYRRGAVEFVGILGQSLREGGRDWRDIKSCLERHPASPSPILSMRAHVSPPPNSASGAFPSSKQWVWANLDRR